MSEIEKSNIKYYMKLEQGTDEWLAARLGIVTASEMNNLVTPTGKQVTGAKVKTYACIKASQRINMQIEETYQSFDMQRGHFQEVIARDVYSDNCGDVTECGFVTRDFGGFKIGASPDGLVDENGGIEIKSRVAKFQVSTILEDAVPAEYVNQIQTFLLATGRNWCDFVQYSNGMPLFVKRVFPDPVRQNTIIKAAGEFEFLVQNIVDAYNEKSAGMIKTERVEYMVDDIIEASEEID